MLGAGQEEEEEGKHSERARGESGRRPAWEPGDHHGKEAERPCRDRLGHRG